MNRRIDLDGCFNFRDLGGYPSEGGRKIRWRRLFRSDALHHLSAADADRVVDELLVGHIVDLRSTAELEAEGRGLLGQRGPRFHHVPLFIQPRDLQRMHRHNFTLDPYRGQLRPGIGAFHGEKAASRQQQVTTHGNHVLQ